MCRVDASKIDFVKIEELGQIGFCEKRLGIAVSTARTHKDTDEASASPQYAAVISRPPATEGRHLENIGTMRQAKKGIQTQTDAP